MPADQQGKARRGEARQTRGRENATSSHPQKLGVDKRVVHPSPERFSLEEKRREEK